VIQYKISVTRLKTVTVIVAQFRHH